MNEGESLPFPREQGLCTLRNGVQLGVTQGGRKEGWLRQRGCFQKGSAHTFAWKSPRSHWLTPLPPTHTACQFPKPRQQQKNHLSNRLSFPGPPSYQVIHTTV